MEVGQMGFQEGLGGGVEETCLSEIWDPSWGGHAWWCGPGACVKGAVLEPFGGVVS